MNANDNLGVALKIREHFSKATDGDCNLIWEDVKGYELADAKKAIEEHHREKGAQAWRPDPKRIKQLCAGYRNARLRAQSKEEKVVDWLKRTARKSGDSRFEGLGDVAALMLHFSECWTDVAAQDVDERGRQGIRAMILNHATRAFGEVGLSDDEAAEMARGIVELKDGQRIMLSSVLKSPELPDTSSFTALKQLAAVA